jgi:hypothetical protein
VVRDVYSGFVVVEGGDKALKSLYLLLAKMMEILGGGRINIQGLEWAQVRVVLAYLISVFEEGWVTEYLLMVFGLIFFVI